MSFPLDKGLLDEPIDPHSQSVISNEFWGSNCHHVQSGISINLTPFWNYYNQQCIHALHDGGRHVAARTHRDVVDVVRELKAGAHVDTIKESLRSKLTANHAHEDEMLGNSISLAASLLLMCDFGSFSEHGFSGRSELRWAKQGSSSLENFLADYFREDPVLAHEKVKLEKNFTARNLGRVAGVEIIWTNNLADHLRLTDDDTKVHIFHHASFLECQKQSPDSMLPAGLAAETLQTLALLLPSTDQDSKRWFTKLISTNTTTVLDSRATYCGRLKTDLRQIERFRFWRDRLVMLKQVFDEAHPKTLGQWWHDRRNGVQWYTFWVAVLVLVLTIFFGLIQSIEGALQVWASFEGLKESN